MKKMLFFLIALGAFPVWSAVYETDKLDVVHELKVGDSYVYTPAGYKITLKSINKHVSVCAVPGFNCGSGYSPEPTYTPVFDIVQNSDCKARILPDHCNTLHQIVKIDLQKSIQIKLVSAFDICLKEDNKANRSSCILNMTVNQYDKPPREPKNCDLIKDDPVVRDSCIERVADKLGDHTICDQMKRPMGFQCTILKASLKKDPEVCKAMKKGPFHHTDDQWKSEIASCVDAVKRLK